MYSKLGCFIKKNKWDFIIVFCCLIVFGLAIFVLSDPEPEPKPSSLIIDLDPNATYDALFDDGNYMVSTGRDSLYVTETRGVRTVVFFNKDNAKSEIYDNNVNIWSNSLVGIKKRIEK